VVELMSEGSLCGAGAFEGTEADQPDPPQKLERLT
jgi:hypothetical protein